MLDFNLTKQKDRDNNTGTSASKALFQRQNPDQIEQGDYKRKYLG